MMAISKFSLPISLSVVILVSACTQSISSSSVYVKKSYLTKEFQDELVTRVYDKAAVLGGECKLLNSQREYHICALEPGNPSLKLSIGYNASGDYRISVESTFGHWLPRSEQEITSGKYIGEQQKHLEKWMRSIVPDQAVSRAERSYLDYDTIEAF